MTSPSMSFDSPATARWSAKPAPEFEELRFREFAESLPQIVFVLDASLEMRFANGQWERYVGALRTSRSALTQWLHAEDLSRFTHAWAEAWQREEAVAIEVRLRRSDGEYRWFHVAGNPARDAGGPIARWYGTATNIDFQKRHGEVLKRAHEALQAADLRKNQFLATLAHELRNPLAPIRTSLDLLERNPPPEVAARVHSVMRRQADHLVRLVDDLLDVARITSGKVEITRKPLSILEAIQGAVEASRPALDALGHSLHMDLADESLQTEGDLVRLTQVFTNLLLNAARYSPAGAQIGVRLARLGDSEITVSVSDNGDGIPPDMLDHIFEPFVQLRTAATAASPGLGIGLALVRTLVELHGGEVIAHSQGLGAGSEFRVRLPALPPADSAGEPVAPESESAVASGQAGLRVMVCDDNQDAAQTLGFLMDELGFASRVVYSGAEALREAPLFRPHLLLLDIGMPGMDGYAVAQALSGMPVRSAMQVWALTGWGQAEDIARTASAGFDGHLVKPVSMVELDAVLSNLVTMRMDEAETARTP